MFYSFFSISSIIPYIALFFKSKSEKARLLSASPQKLKQRKTRRKTGEKAFLRHPKNRPERGENRGFLFLPAKGPWNTHRFQSLKIPLPQCLVHGNGHRIGKIQRAQTFPHGNTNTGILVAL